jgi:hypothetical protein
MVRGGNTHRHADTQHRERSREIKRDQERDQEREFKREFKRESSRESSRERVQEREFKRERDVQTHNTRHKIEAHKKPMAYTRQTTTRGTKENPRGRTL